MDRIIFRIIFLGCLSFALTSCRTKAPECLSTGTTDDEIQIREKAIRLQLEELEVMQHTKERITPAANRPEVQFNVVLDRANKAKDAIYSDQEYLRALQTFNEASDRRHKAVMAELKVYAEVANSDYISDFQKPASTNANQTKIPPVPVPANH